MIYQSTKDMLKALKIEPSEKPDISNPLFAWHVKVLKVKRRNLVCLVNDASKLSMVLYGMTAKEYKKFDDHVQREMPQVLKDCGVPSPIIEAYLEETGEGIFTSSGSRKQLGILNNVATEAELLFDELSEPGLLQRKLSAQQNSMLVKNDDGEYITPKDVIKDLLKKTYGETTVSFDLGEIALYMFGGDLMGMEPFLNIRDGSIYVAMEHGNELEDLEYDEDYIRIPVEGFDFFYYFRRFLRGIDHKEFEQKLDRLKLGKGAIGRIKNLLSGYPEIQKKWYEYEEKVQEELVKEWLESEGLM